MSIVNLIASLLAWFAMKRVDDIVGKWVAYITIAFQNAATERAKEAYRQATMDVQKDLKNSYGTWEEWRKKAGIVT